MPVTARTFRTTGLPTTRRSSPPAAWARHSAAASALSPLESQNSVEVMSTTTVVSTSSGGVTIGIRRSVGAWVPMSA
jgi:hypothetical protein